MAVPMPTKSTIPNANNHHCWWRQYYMTFCYSNSTQTTFACVCLYIKRQTHLFHSIASNHVASTVSHPQTINTQTHTHSHTSVELNVMPLIWCERFCMSVWPLWASTESKINIGILVWNDFDLDSDSSSLPVGEYVNVDFVTKQSTLTLFGSVCILRIRTYRAVVFGA